MPRGATRDARGQSTGSRRGNMELGGEAAGASHLRVTFLSVHTSEDTKTD